MGHKMPKDKDRRIIHVCESFAYGAANSTMLLSELMLKEEASITIFYGERQGTEKIDIGSFKEITWKKLDNKNVLSHVQNIYQIAKYIRSIKDNNVVLHGQSSYGGMYAKFAGALTGRPVIYSPRGLSYLRQDMPLLKRRAFKIIEKLTAPLATIVACGPSEHKETLKLSKSSLGIYNGLPLGEFSTGTPQDYLLGVGRICHQKGFDIFKDVARANPDQNFVWAGSPDAAGKKLIANLPDNLELVGFVSHEEIIELIKGCKAVLLPSRWEGLSRFLLETISIGRPIITSSFPGNTDCLNRENENENGYSNGYSCQTIDEYSQAISDLSNVELAKKMGVESRRLAEKCYDLKKINEKWVALYKAKTN